GMQGGGLGNIGNRYQMAANQFGNLGGQFGQQGGNLGMLGGLPQQPRLSFDELQKRRQQNQQAKGEAKQVGKALAAMDPGQGIASAASAEEIGDFFRYVIDEKVSLPRQKSAMLPIVNKDVQVSRVSIYNEAVHGKFPLLGLRFKNTTGLHLMQGPITVYE